jgi:pimeloyl-ACP methyl ester carboxylesterase
VEQPETHYATSGGVSIAYQVLGEGPFDIVYVPGFVSHLELRWGVPSFAESLRHLASFSRLILFDKRGTGMSDPVAGAPTLETRMDDLRAVMDAAGSRRAAVVGISEGAPMSVLFGATYPERTAALVLRSGFPRTMWAPDYPWGRTDDQYRQELERQLRIFRSRDEALSVVRSLADWTEADVPAILDYFRWCASPGAWRALLDMNKDIDVRHVLPAIRVPTLIVHGTDDTTVPIDAARWMAQHVPGAQFAEIPGGGHLHFARDWPIVNEEIRRFLTVVWEAGAWEDAEPDRVLATILFSDIVGSSERAAELGDRAWGELLERHHGSVRRELLRFRGHEVDTAGDGFLATFDGPARAIRCACALVEAVKELGLEIRVGLHTGECEIAGGKIAGIAVHTGARVAARAEAGEVLVSQTVKDLVAGSGLRFEDRGSHELKGIRGEWRLYRIDPSSLHPNV